MSDNRVDHDDLYRLAEAQSGYFTAQQALAAGMDRSTLLHHARPRGRYLRVRRGLYRLRHFPSAAQEHVVAGWLPLRDVGAVVSHASAFEMYGLSDVIPDAVHLTLPRARRGQRPRRGVRIHTSAQPPASSELRHIQGIPVTSPERSVVDALEAGVQPEQVELAIRQALTRGLTTRRRLTTAAANRSTWVKAFVEAISAEVGM